MAEVKNEATVDAKEVKERSKTDRFKEHVQKIIFQELGVKVSKDKAWSLFKAITHGTFEFVLNEEDKKLPLAGVGTYEILETKPRGSKAGLDKDGNPIEGAEAWECVPRPRFYPSSVMNKMVEQVYGLADHGVEIEHYGIFKAEEPIAEKVEKAEKSAKKDKAPKKEAVKAEAVAEATDEVDVDLDEEF